MKFPVTRDLVNDLSMILLDAEDVLYMEVEERTVVFHTADDKYYLLDTLSELSKRMSSLGFQKLDRINLVNMNKVKQFDEKNGKVFFDKENSEHSKSTTVSFTNRSMLLEFVRSNKNNNNTIDI